MRLLIKSAKIVDSKSPYHLQQKDILIENGIIKAIENSIDQTADNEIHIKHLHVSQGWFDSSVSFGEPGFEERETLKNGLDTAMKSGFTSVILNANTKPIIDNAALVQYLKTKTQNHIVQALISGALTEQSKNEQLAELFDMHQHHAVVFGDYKKGINSANLLKLALQYVKGFGGLVQVFPIENSLSQQAQMHEGLISTSLGLKALPRMAEVIQLKRDLDLLKYTNSKIHFSCISTAESVELIKKAKKEGLEVTCSVAISNLIYTAEKLGDFDSRYKVWPPLRETSDQKALIKGLKSGIIDMVTTDHQPLNIELKKTEFEHAAFGSIGLESAFGVLNEKLGLEDTISYLTRGKSRFNLSTSPIDVGQNADLTLLDPKAQWTFSETDIFSKSKNAIFLGEKMKGKALGIINKNQFYVSES
ncbi:dihydroorotase [Mesohalobacter halotolerans]|uniref:Dihydroorotase n=1 Tax=Mesohalobacter halotolerans TaxID=1883405 RepID=A0A4U5TPC1_9FLAO|nr:dihydroorotase [Mesohalobacter halotolerans]MBS3739164.1 dihydroorotase [Psychroflexus sp.]TKS55950.1 dihydroorotase [Mesohalobacter halotolerans]